MDADVHVFPPKILFFFLRKNESFQLETFVINLKYISVCTFTDGAVHRWQVLFQVKDTDRSLYTCAGKKYQGV